MTTVVRKWGSSLAVRIPKAVAEELGVGPGTTVRITGEKGWIVITPAVPSYTLDRLLKGITARNRHRQTDTGAPRGVEVW